MPLEVVSHIHEQPVVWCYVCGAGFGASKMGGVYERHVSHCSEQNEDMLRDLSYRTRAPQLFDPFVSGDVELGAWIRANAKAIFDRQLKI